MSIEQLSVLQQKINANWNQRAAQSQGEAHHVMRDEAEHRLWLDLVRPLLPAQPADVIDVGTGTGFLAWVMADLGHRVTGFDLSEGMLGDGRAIADERSRTTPDGTAPEFRVGDAMDPPMPPQSLDVIANRNVLWTLLDPSRAFRIWRSLLRPAGRVVAIHGVRLDEHTGEEKTNRAESPYYTPDVVAYLLPIRYRPTLDPVVPVLSEAGFTDITIVRWQELERFYLERDQRKYHWLALTGVKTPSPSGRG
jgi:SAM-dependent methyltransferase